MLAFMVGSQKDTEYQTAQIQGVDSLSCSYIHHINEQQALLFFEGESTYSVMVEEPGATQHPLTLIGGGKVISVSQSASSPTVFLSLEDSLKRRVIHRSLDRGESWEHMITFHENSICGTPLFMNDSVGYMKISAYTLDGKEQSALARSETGGRRWASVNTEFLGYQPVLIDEQGQLNGVVEDYSAVWETHEDQIYYIYVDSIEGYEIPYIDDMSRNTITGNEHNIMIYDKKKEQTYVRVNSADFHDQSSLITVYLDTERSLPRGTTQIQASEGDFYAVSSTAGGYSNQNRTIKRHHSRWGVTWTSKKIKSSDVVAYSLGENGQLWAVTDNHELHIIY